MQLVLPNTRREPTRGLVSEAQVEELPAQYVGLKDSRRYRLSKEQVEKAMRLYLVDGLPVDEIAKQVDAPSGKTISNLAFRKGWQKKRKAIERKKERAAEKAVETVLQRVSVRLEASSERALALFEDSLDGAALQAPGKRLTTLQEAKTALAIVDNVSGRDQAKLSAASGPTIHLHAHAWLPQRVESPVETAQPISIPVESEYVTEAESTPDAGEQ